MATWKCLVTVRCFAGQQKEGKENTKAERKNKKSQLAIGYKKRIDNEERGQIGTALVRCIGLVRAQLSDATIVEIVLGSGSRTRSMRTNQRLIAN